MKILTFFFWAIFLMACNKSNSVKSRNGGSLPDMPNNVPVLVSKSFAKSSLIQSLVISNKGKIDKSAPSVYFITPLDNSSVNGTVNIIVSAKDNVGVVLNTISINDVKVVTGYSYSWNTNGLPSGFHKISATATDAAGNSRTTSILVSILTQVIEPPVVGGTQIGNMPPVADQGSEGSCVAFAVGYAARSVDWYNKTGVLSLFSPEHLYNQIKFSVDCNSGSAMQPALDFIQQNGILPYQSMPYSSTNGCSIQPTEFQKNEALNYKITGYYKMYCTDTSIIKSMIRMNVPVIINVLADNSFINSNASFIWKQYSGSGSLPHCIVISGYDDKLNAYRIMNSWGTGWGDAGYNWIDYDFFLTRTGTYCYAIK